MKLGERLCPLNQREAENRKTRLAIRTAFASCLPMALLLALSSALQAQFTFVTNNGAITITGYTGPGGPVEIPTTTNRLLKKACFEKTTPKIIGVFA